MTQDQFNVKENVHDKKGSREPERKSASDETSHEKEVEGFVPVSHEDVEEIHTDPHDTPFDQSAAGRGASLRRTPHHEAHPDDGEEEDSNVLHPLMNRLSNRLLSRNTQMSRSTASKFDDLHPYTSVLSVSNVDECEMVENDAFPEHERCSREKFIYRLTQCPELSLGIFSRPIPSEAAKSHVEDKAKLLALVIATRSPAPAVTDATMGVPPDWRSRHSALPSPDEPEALGHQNEGRTICVHSLAVAKEHQRKGLGSILMKAYIQRIKDSKTADRVALIAHDHLVKFYTGLGFRDMGESLCTFGHGGWKNLILDFSPDQDD